MDLDLMREIPADQLSAIDGEFGHEFGFSPVTVADVIRGLAGIGYGGHYDECSPDEDAVLRFIGRAGEEREAIFAARQDYTEALRNAVDAVVWPIVYHWCPVCLRRDDNHPFEACFGQDWLDHDPLRPSESPNTLGP